jgi:hypothetical protein
MKEEGRRKKAGFQGSLPDGVKRILTFISLSSVWAGTVLAQSPVTVTVDTRVLGAVIPDSFVGLSFGMKTLLAGRDGGHFFSATNTPLAALFQNLGLRHFRAGGTTVESPPNTRIPDETDIANLFAFARGAGVQKIIYSLRLLETDPARPYAATNAAIAKYIWNHYRTNLECFAIGNEPDRKTIYSKDLTITNFTTYLAKWRKFAAAITNAVPDAKFAGPDAGSGNVYWTTQFAAAEKNSGLISIVTEHYYAGGAGRGVPAQQGVDGMLSPHWLETSQTLYDKMAKPVLANGLPFRFTEANDHYSGGIPDASDTFAGALWALDFLHWWAAHDAQGVDFHNTEWVASDVIHLDENGQPIINPKGYGLKAFDLGGHGRIAPVTISNLDGINLTAYAVRSAKHLFVTLINKEHGPGARSTEVTLVCGEKARSAAAIFLTAPDEDVTAKTGVTLGGATISNDGPWRGKWKPLAFTRAAQVSVLVPATSAAIVKIK